MELHDRLKLARERRGFGSAAEAAEALGVPYGTYSGHENGGRGIPRKKVARYAQFFGVSVPWLEHGDGDAPKAPAKAEMWKNLGSEKISVEEAVAFVEGALLSTGLKAEWLPELHEQLRECLAEPLVLQNPGAEIDSRRNIAKTVVSQFLRRRGAQVKT